MFYLELFRALNSHDVRYLLVGGLAVNLHGVPRVTMDVDLIVGLDGENLRRFLAAADDLGLTPGVPVGIEELLDPDQRTLWTSEKGMVAFPLRPPTPDGRHPPGSAAGPARRFRAGRDAQRRRHHGPPRLH